MFRPAVGPTKYSVEWELVLIGPGREFIHSTPFSAEVPLMSSKPRLGHIYTYLGAFAKLRKAAINFVMSVRPCIRMEQRDSH